jgi:hypothetical protein
MNNHVNLIPQESNGAEYCLQIFEVIKGHYILDIFLDKLRAERFAEEHEAEVKPFPKYPEKK